MIFDDEFIEELLKNN
jgi:hypothetical protein